MVSINVKNIVFSSLLTVIPTHTVCYHYSLQKPACYNVLMQENISVEVRQWLNKRGVNNDTIALFNIHEVDHFLTGAGTIAIPVNNPDGTFSFNKYRRSPFIDAPHLPKYVYDKGGRTTLFGAERLAADNKKVIITEGELDTLVCHSLGLNAVSSTGGALSFQPHFAELLNGYEVYICFDNDEAGAAGIVKTLQYLPEAKVVLIPEIVGVKDITDFVSRGGDIHSLLSTAFNPTLEFVMEDKLKRAAVWLPVRFHNEYLKQMTPVSRPSLPTDTEGKVKAADPKVVGKIQAAKEYPCDRIMEFVKNKACCPVHFEKTPSLHYYPANNTCYCYGCSKHFDSIGLYQAVHKCGFKEALDKLAK